MEQTIKDIIQQHFGVEADVQLTRPEAQFGDYATNVAMQLAKPLGKNPREIAEEIANALRTHESFKDVQVAGPGFINVFLRDDVILQSIKDTPQTPYQNKKVVLEYSCPNAFKELHTGHLYQTIFGDILARLLAVGGANVQRTSFGGDVGLHVAKCLWGMVQELDGENPEKLASIGEDSFERARWISQCYVKGAQAYESDATVKVSIDALNKQIYGFHDAQDKTSPLAQIYWTTRQWSFDYFDAFYDLIKVDHMHYYPESSTATVGLEVVKTQLEKGNLKRSEGAVIFEGDESRHLHTRVFITGAGLPTYETKDVGVIWHEKTDYDFDHRILITGNDQKEYMRVVFAAAEVFRPELVGQMTHLTHGTVRFGDGKKMSSRLGNVSRAVDVIDIVRDKVRELVKDESLIEDVTLGAIKYVFAKYRVGGDIAFDVDETVSLNGNSGPYLQYAHARARRILEKVTANVASLTEIHDEDRLLVRMLSEYHEVVELAASQLEPHHICTYLFELAQEFNRYYEKNHVVGNEQEAHRAALVGMYADTLRDGLAILGITAPDRM